MTKYYVTFVTDLSSEIHADSPEEAIEKLKESIKGDSYDNSEFEVQEV